MAWEYQELLNQNLQIIFLLALGAGSVYFKLFRQDIDLPTFNKFVFAILLPASVLTGLGMRSNLRDGALWRFVGGFLMMRAIGLLGTFVVFFRKGIGQVTANWLFISWVSTVILGVPLLRAALGPQYSNLGVVAGISSFIFQLPVMLIMFEIFATQRVSPEISSLEEGRTTIASTPSSTPIINTEDASKSHTTSDYERESPNGSSFLPTSNINPTTSTTALNQTQTPLVKPQRLRWISRTQIKAIVVQILRNPILWAIFIGLILSVTTLGPKYLYPGNPPQQPNCNYVPGAGFIYLFFSTLAASTEPVAIFATGMFLMYKNPIACGWVRSILYMIVKVIIVPALMVGCAAAVGLEGANARAAVLLAALPISAAAFSLSDKYKVGTAEAVANIFWGNLLVLPTTLAWMAFMDGVDLFPMQKSSVPNACAAPPAAG